MKKILVIVLVVMSVAVGGYAEAASGKKRTRSANRIGPYGGAQVGYTTFSAETAEEDVEALENTLENAGVASQNLSSGTEDTDIGYQATFGYRFHRYFAVELGLAQFGSLESTARADIDFDNGDGFLPTSVKLSFTAGGPVFSAIGILPINDKFELFARLGYLFTSTDREFSARIDGESAGSGSSKGDSQDPVMGLGFAWHINQVYSIRGEYQQINEVGEANLTGEEDLKVMTLGVIIRF
jgi:OOP family OmpA-OmpF porin